MKPKNVVILFCLALMAVFPIISDRYLVSIANFIGIYGMLALGLTLLMGYGGQVSMGQVIFLGIGAYASAILTQREGFSPWLALLIGIALAASTAAVLGIILFRMKGHVFAVVSLGMSLIFYYLCIQLSSLTGGWDGISAIPYLSIGGFQMNKDYHYYYLVWVALLLSLVVSRNIVKSRVGRAIQSFHPFSGGSEEAALAVGVWPIKYKIQTLILSAIFGSIAGSLYAHWISFVSPSVVDVGINIAALTMVTIGGLGSLSGAIFGAALILLAGEGLRALIPFVLPGTTGPFESIAYGLILILTLQFLPRGLVISGGDALRRRWKK